MAIIDLLQLFQSVVMPMGASSGPTLSAIPIPGAESHRLAKDASGSPCVLIRQGPRMVRPPPIKLENLLVSFDVSCSVRDHVGRLDEDTFTIIRCLEHSLLPHFLRIVSPVIATLGVKPTAEAVRAAVVGLVELFQALSVPGHKKIQGIWAELLLIRLARDPFEMVTSWHRDSYERFDFALGPDRIEVKSNSYRRREHSFSLQQVTPSGGARIVIASILVERCGGGVSLGRLLNETRELLSHNATLVSRLDLILYSALGSGWADALDESFDLELAMESIAFYEASDIPRPLNSCPQNVFDVRFRADLSLIPILGESQMGERGKLFRAVLPLRQTASKFGQQGRVCP